MTETWTADEYKEFQRTGKPPVREMPHEQESEPEPTKAEIQAEKELQKLCELELCRRGMPYLHLSPKAREKAGWPDLTFALAGKPIATELKSKNGKLRKVQVEMLTRMHEHGWQVYVIRKMETFIDLLNGHEPDQWRPE